jgi:hypothetical protein
MNVVDMNAVWVLFLEIKKGEKQNTHVTWQKKTAI